MDKDFLSFRVKQAIDTVLPLIGLSVALLWLGQALYEILTVDVFAVVWLLPFNTAMHAVSALNISVLYLINYLFFRTFIPGHLRVVRAMMFTIIGAVFYDLTWSTLNIVVNGYGSVVLPLTSFVVVFAYLLIFDRRMFKILDVTAWKVLFVVVVYFGSLVLFVGSGFFVQFGLYEAGLAVDPHGWVWLLHKSVVLWMWSVFALR